MNAAIAQMRELAPKFQLTKESLPRARHLPGMVYSSEDIYALEKERIFMTHWLSVGRVEEIPNVGDYMTFSVMNEPIIISRPAPDEIRVCMNMCLHRGVAVASGCGNAKDFSCPYHAWLFDVGGRLIAAPGMKESEVDMTGASLTQLPVKIWRGWIFTNFSESPQPFEEFIEPYEEKLWWFQSGECRLADKVVIDVKCNWKFLVENLIDIYHVGVIHRSTFGGFVKGEKIGFQLERDGGWHTQYEARPHSKGGQQVFPTLPWAQDKSPGIACKAGIYPNLNLSMRADSLRMWHVWPVSPNETRIICYLLFPDNAFSIPDYEAELGKYREFVKQIIAEDAVMVESLQNAAASKFLKPGPMSPLEGALHHMEQHYIDLMTREA
ncbi:Biphenyl dioxygenase subunit alpha [Pigmentiphaga humi]|uniref:Biphenyl dioxygenase subunit alpha n=1 Tax=Pigmentiphaga humi TaxID=2478468 RepID=A0A3P4B5E0_9BURK|nr:aromatic ring-hydroxylating dioxygenase subunit alpha [Pigmentiphaga humi]VCU70878.1 Biphenyl dioxygenase subunit alpha [Pigmentiphaga humi]